MTGRPLTVREGRSQLAGPFTGVPSHLEAPLKHWLGQSFKYAPGGTRQVDVSSLVMVSSALHIPLTYGGLGDQLFRELLAYCDDDPEQMLDVVHATAQLVEHATIGTLDDLLMHGGSVWTARWGRGLELRVNSAATEAYEQATAPADSASVELDEAWARAYGRNPDPSDAWDHAIKAVEAVLIPIVVPTQDGAHLGHVVGQLDRQGEQWSTALRFNQTRPPDNPPHNSVQALVGMLRLIYPNPDRHVGRDHRTPTIEEAHAVVHLAVTIVQWGRNRWIVRR